MNDWKELINSLENKYNKLANSVNKEIETIYKTTMKELNNLINEYLLDTTDKATYKQINQYYKDMNRLLNSLSETETEVAQKQHTLLKVYLTVSVLDMTMQRINLNLTIMNILISKAISTFLTKAYKDSYYSNTYNIHRAGITDTLIKLKSKDVQNKVNSKWSGDSYTNRLIRTKDNVVNKIHDVLVVGNNYEQSAKEIKGNINKIIKPIKSQTNTLLKTELNHVINESTVEAFKEAEIEQFQIISTLDTRTSKVCIKKDLQIINTNDLKIASKIPPFHPNCRSVIVPYFDDSTELRRARNILGRGTTVAGKLNYTEWKEKYKIS